MTILKSLKPIVSLCKRRGFIYPGSEIYGGFANTYSYGPYGAELKKNIKDLWWKRFVHDRSDIIGIDGPILLHPKSWEASGHLEGFNDAFIDCKSCKVRYRVDHLIEEALHIEIQNLDLKSCNLLIKENRILCPKCKEHNFTEARNFNLMFSTSMGKTADKEEIAFLRPETAQAIFLEFKNILDSTRIRLPFGIAQIGKAFRNEITPGNFIFRTIEFEQMEIEYFIPENLWERTFEEWRKHLHSWCHAIGLSSKNIEEKEHTKEQLSHYSKRTIDITYRFPFGMSELYGLSYRTNYDLTRHEQYSKISQEYVDPETNERFIPHVIEPTFGVDRTLLALLCEAYEEEKLENNETRTILHFSPIIAPIKCAVFPLMKKQELVAKAQKVYDLLRPLWYTEFDISGAIGRRYRRQDELGTPFCITIDYDTLEDQTVTLRDRDTMKQERIAIANLSDILKEKLL